MKSFTPIISIVGEIQKGKQVEMKTNPGYWTLLYVTKGSLRANDELITFQAMRSYLIRFLTIKNKYHE